MKYCVVVDRGRHQDYVYHVLHQVEGTYWTMCGHAVNTEDVRGAWHGLVNETRPVGRDLCKRCLKVMLKRGLKPWEW